MCDHRVVKVWGQPPSAVRRAQLGFEPQSALVLSAQSLASKLAGTAEGGCPHVWQERLSHAPIYFDACHTTRFQSLWCAQSLQPRRTQQLLHRVPTSPPSLPHSVIGSSRSRWRCHLRVRPPLDITGTLIQRPAKLSNWTRYSTT